MLARCIPTVTEPVKGTEAWLNCCDISQPYYYLSDEGEKNQGIRTRFHIDVLAVATNWCKSISLSINNSKQSSYCKINKTPWYYVCFCIFDWYKRVLQARKININKYPQIACFWCNPPHTLLVLKEKTKIWQLALILFIFYFLKFLAF